MSSRVDDRSMHELYLWPFADSVKAGVASVMCSYNKINGQWHLSCPLSFFCLRSSALHHPMLYELLGNTQ
jgi:beta-glucosidase-like glycosyl hydrolase